MGKEKTIEERIAFLTDLSLTPLIWGISPRFRIGWKTLPPVLTPGSLVTFTGDVTKQNQADVKNSCLLAQLAANKKYDREKQTEQWYRFYAELLENVGWVIRELQFSKITSTEGDFEASAIMLKILEGVCTGDEKTAIIATMQALSVLAKNDYRIRIFESCSHSAQMGNFQLSSCIMEDGAVTMHLGACYFSTTQHITRLLFTKFSFSDVDAYQGSQTVELDMDVYDRVRQLIIDKLGDNAEKYIGDLEI